jgi:hypothetical protein
MNTDKQDDVDLIMKSNLPARIKRDKIRQMLATQKADLLNQVEEKVIGKDGLYSNRKARAQELIDTVGEDKVPTLHAMYTIARTDLRHTQRQALNELRG